MVARSHNNRSEKQKGHVPVQDGAHGPSHEGHQGVETARDRSGADGRQDGKGRQNGGGDGAGGAPKQQGQKQANKGLDNHHQNRGHG